MSYQPSDPNEIAKRGIDIYQRRYRVEYERKWRGRFAAIDIHSEQAFVADFPEDALSIAKASAPHGIFYLVRIGSRGTFKTSRLGADAGSRDV